MAETKDTGAETLHLKKYPNRRYYDAAHSRHLKLREIHNLVKAGQSIQVTEGQDGRDITAEVLLGMLLEFEPEKVATVPALALASWIRMDLEKARELLGDKTHPLFQAMADYKELIRTELTSSPAMQEILPAVKQMAKDIVSPFQSAITATTTGQSKSEPHVTAGNARNEDLEELLRAFESKKEGST